jgi:hypothetical protein
LDESSKLANTKTYDTAINIIGSLKDINVLTKSFKSHFDPEDSLENLISVRNELNLRTDKSRARIESSIKESFIQFKDNNHYKLLEKIFSGNDYNTEFQYILFWQFSLTNKLFRDISTHLFLPTYFTGKIGLSKDDVFAYIKELINQNKHQNLKWSENTIETIARKYLSLMTKLGFLEGKHKKKTFTHIRPSDESLVIFLYFSQLHNPTNKNLFKNDFLSLSFVNAKDILERLKKISLKGFFNMSFNGVDLYIELAQSYEGICDALYNRS